MQERLSQFQATEERLTVNVEKSADELEAAHQADMLELLDALDMTTITEHGNVTTITAELDAFRLKKVYTNKDDERIAELLAPISLLLPFKSHTDVGIGLFMMTFAGPVIDIYPSFQTWLHSGGASPDALNESSLAMHRLYNLKPRKHISHNDINVAFNAIEFSVTTHTDTQEAIIERRATVPMQVPFLQTIGDCACLGSNASNRSIFIGDGYADLYQLEPHNVDNFLQTLSMIVGLGVMVTRMSNEFNETDLFADIEWQEETFPRR